MKNTDQDTNEQLLESTNHQKNKTFLFQGAKERKSLRVQRIPCLFSNSCAQFEEHPMAEPTSRSAAIAAFLIGIAIGLLIMLTGCGSFTDREVIDQDKGTTNEIPSIASAFFTGASAAIAPALPPPAQPIALLTSVAVTGLLGYLGRSLLASKKRKQMVTNFEADHATLGRDAATAKLLNTLVPGTVSLPANGGAK